MIPEYNELLLGMQNVDLDWKPVEMFQMILICKMHAATAQCVCLLLVEK